MMRSGLYRLSSLRLPSPSCSPPSRALSSLLRLQRPLPSESAAGRAVPVFSRQEPQELWLFSPRATRAVAFLAKSHKS
eukprot:1436905-Rhodomonas_salina.1